AYNGFGYAPDNVGGNWIGNSTPLGNHGLVSVSGVIEQRYDADVFSFDVLKTGDVTFQARGAYYGNTRIGTLDADLQILNSSANVVANALTSNLDESLTVNLSPGRYFITVSGHQNYGDVGQYTLSINAPNNRAPYPGPNAAPLPGTVEMENYDSGGEG